MDNSLTSRAVIVGHLILTVPTIAAIVAVPFLTLRTFGPGVAIAYYVLAAVALGWQWYSMVLPRWRKWSLGKGIQMEDLERLARRSGFAWPVESAIGPFALHTAGAALCGLRLGPWLLSRWYVWIVPLSGMSGHAPTGNDWLQHFELTSIVPALVVGYVVSCYLPKLATSAWVLPTIILSYKLLTFTEPPASVLILHHSIRWEYFFIIQRSMPTFTPGFGGVDPIRVAEQIDVVAPFYAGLAYSIGAIAQTHGLLRRIFGSSAIRPEAQTTPAEENR
jgi:hypothetical protein